jgi:hypothetical protein
MFTGNYDHLPRDEIPLIQLARHKENMHDEDEICFQPASARLTIDRKGYEINQGSRANPLMGAPTHTPDRF